MKIENNVISFLQKLKNDEVRQKDLPPLEQLDVQKIEFDKNMIFSRKLFKILEKSVHDTKKVCIQTLIIGDENLTKWLNTMYIKHEKRLFTMLYLNQINERAK